jgi:hypothetical protein
MTISEAQRRLEAARVQRDLGLIHEAQNTPATWDPKHHEWVPDGEVPSKVRRDLEFARKYPHLEASRQYFMDTLTEPPLANLTAVTATTITALWSAATYTPLAAYDANRPGKTYRLCAGGIVSTSTSGTLIITPNVGVATGGATMGASVTQTVPVSLTNVAWYLEMQIVIRTTGTSGTCIGTGFFNSAGAAATAGNAWVLAFGGTSATIDTTIANGFTIGWTLSVAGSVTPQWVTWQSLN